jgi:hypothetical protein
MRDLVALLANGARRIVRDNDDLMRLILESLELLEQRLVHSDLPAVDDLWLWKEAGLQRSNFRHKDEEFISDYIARWLRDTIGPDSKVVVNREVQPQRGDRTDILVQAWSQTPAGRNRTETPLSVTIEVKGCWNPGIRNGAKTQLLEQYLRPFGRSHGIFLVAWFHSPACPKIATKQNSHLDVDLAEDAIRKVHEFVEPARISGFRVVPAVLDCRKKE